MKIITRILMLYILAGHLIALFIAPYSSKELEVLQFKDLLVLVWGGLYVLSILFMWIYLFRHWGISVFTGPSVKRMWFWVVLVGGLLYFVGPMIYYIFVFEMGKGLEVNGDGQKAPG